MKFSQAPTIFARKANLERFHKWIDTDNLIILTLEITKFQGTWIKQVWCKVIVRTLNRRWTYAFSGRLPQPFQRVCYIKNLKKYIYPCHCPKFFVARKAQDAGLELRAPPLALCWGYSHAPTPTLMYALFADTILYYFFLVLTLVSALVRPMHFWTYLYGLGFVLWTWSYARAHRP